MTHPRDNHRRDSQPLLRRRRQGSASCDLARAGAVVAALILAAPGHAEVIRLTCDEVVARALAVSHAADAASHQTAAAAAATAAADAARLPVVTVGATVAERSSVPEYRLPLTLDGQPGPLLMPDIRTTFAASLAGQQTLYAGGAIRASRRAAREDLRAGEASQEVTSAEVRLQARTSYWDAVDAEARLEAARSARSRADRVVVDAQALLDAGMAVRADLLAAQERAASARLTVIRTESAAAIARARLASLLHLTARDVFEFADAPISKLPPQPAPLADLQRSATARPELAEVDARLAALASRETLSLAAIRPAVSLAAQWDLGRPNSRYFPLTDEWNDSWSVGLAATWKLFDGGRAAADAAAARATARALASSGEELRRAIDFEVEASRRRLTDALAAVEAADAAVAAASARQSAAAERMAAGLATMVEVLDAEAALAAAEQSGIEVRAGAWLAAAALDRAVGR